MPHARTRSALLAAAIAASAGLALGGCAADPGDVVRGALGGAVEGATGGDVQFGDLPEDFPADEIPLVEGEVLATAATPEGGWVITIKASGAGDPVADAVALLEEDGYEAAPALERLQLDAAAARGNGTWNVLLAGGEQGLVYTIIPVQ